MLIGPRPGGEGLQLVRECEQMHRSVAHRCFRAVVGPAQPVVEPVLAFALSDKGKWAVPGRNSSTARRAAARPNTTMSTSELQPSRLAPCTETQAASPTAISPDTTASGSPAVDRITSPR